MKGAGTGVDLCRDMHGRRRERETEEGTKRQNTKEKEKGLDGAQSSCDGTIASTLCIT